MVKKYHVSYTTQNIKKKNTMKCERFITPSRHIKKRCSFILKLCGCDRLCFSELFIYFNYLLLKHSSCPAVHYRGARSSRYEMD